MTRMLLNKTLLAHAYSREIRKMNKDINLKEFQEIAVLLQSCPTTYIIGLTNACQLRCPLCITGLRKQQKKVKFMEFDLFKEIIEKIKNYALHVQLYKWGESLLHKDIVEILKYCNCYDLNTEISSNLSLDKIDEKLEAMVKYRLKHLIVSFDGVTQDDYVRYRINGNIDLVLKNISKLCKIKQHYDCVFPRISLQFLRNKYTGNQVEVLKANYKKWGADDYYVCDMTTVFKDRDLKTAKEWFDDEEIKRRRYLDIDTSMHRKICYFLYTTMIIEQDGSIPSCCFVTDTKDDYSKWDSSKSISEMYNSERFIQARKMFKGKRSNSSLTCKDCCVFMTYLEKESEKTIKDNWYVSRHKDDLDGSKKMDIAAMKNSIIRFMEDGKVSLAEEAIDVSLNKYPDSLELQVLKAEFKTQIRNNKDAKNILLGIIKNKPDHIDALNMLAAIELSERQVMSSAELIRHVLILDKSNQEALATMAKAKNTWGLPDVHK